MVRKRTRPPADRTAMLEHTECPCCRAPNLRTEIMCFACGASLRPRPKRFRPLLASAPWVLWLGLFAGLAVVAVVGWQAASWLADYRARAALPGWYFPAGAGALVVIGQGTLAHARRADRRWWKLRRAPRLPLAQAHPGDTVWVRGRVECDSPLVAPYAAVECVYYRYRVQERKEGESGWRVTERDTKCVDFELTQEGERIYIPSGGVLFDAQLYHEGFVDSLGMAQVKVYAFPVGLQAGAYGLVAGEADRPRLDAAGDELPVVVTWRDPSDYIALTGSRARRARILGWMLTLLGALALIATVAKV